MNGRNSIHLAQFFLFFLPFCHDSVGTTQSEVAAGSDEEKTCDEISHDQC